jgi:RNA polymerase sigma-70 factor, ECF subfamily
LDVLKSSRHKRETYIGPWNPEPFLLDPSTEFDPPEAALRKEGLSIGYLRMMEHLSPNERAILLLREVFDFSYNEIAHMMEIKEDNCRKVFSRAKQKIARVEGESLDYKKNQSIINRFIEALQMQNMDTLLKLLSKNVTLYSDGGGKVKAAIRPIYSQTNVLSLFYGILKMVPKDFSSELRNVNWQPAVVNYSKNQIHSIVSFYICNDIIEEIYIIMNPDKLPVI